MNNEQSTTNTIKNKPNQSQFQTRKHLTPLAGQGIATSLRSVEMTAGTGPGVIMRRQRESFSRGNKIGALLEPTIRSRCDRLFHLFWEIGPENLSNFLLDILFAPCTLSPGL
jgi:hypothetical protein